MDVPDLFLAPSSLGFVRVAAIGPELRVADVSFNVEKIGDAFPGICYGVVQPGDPVDSGTPLIRVTDLEGGAPEASKLKIIDVAIDKQYQRSRVSAGDVLVSIVGTIGRTWTVTEELAGANIARALAKIPAQPEKVRPNYLRAVLATPSYQATLVGSAFETARKTLNLSVLRELEIPVPDMAQQDRLLASALVLEEAIRVSQEAAQSAQTLRDALLQEVFKGSS